MIIEFVIRDCAMWAPTLESRSDWLAWARRDLRELPPEVEIAPQLDVMPAMTRRRLNQLGRMAAHVAYAAARSPTEDDDLSSLSTPMIFASRYGDASRSLALLADLVQEHPISPTSFSLSVHNAIGAMISIARSDRSPQCAIAAGAASAGAAILEAYGLLADGAPEVIIVCFDSPLPGAYRAFSDEPAAPYAWAWRLARPRESEPRIRLTLTPDQSAFGWPSDNEKLPFGLALLQFGLADSDHWQRVADHKQWRFSRHQCAEPGGAK